MIHYPLKPTVTTRYLSGWQQAQENLKEFLNEYKQGKGKKKVSNQRNQ